MMNRPVLIFTVKNECPAQQMADTSRALRERLSEFEVIVIAGDIDVTLISDKDEAIKKIDVQIADLEKLKEYLDGGY